MMTLNIDVTMKEHAYKSARDSVRAHDFPVKFFKMLKNP